MQRLIEVALRDPEETLEKVASFGRATETSLRHKIWRRVKRGNLYAEQDQIGEDILFIAHRKLLSHAVSD